MTNHRHCADTSDLVFRWSVEVDGAVVANGSLSVLTITSGEWAEVEIPDAADTAMRSKRSIGPGGEPPVGCGIPGVGCRIPRVGAAFGAGDAVLTVEAALAADARWAPAGHVIAWGQRVRDAVLRTCSRSGRIR